MTDFTDAAAATLAVLKNMARDLESHLGLAERVRSAHPNLNDVPEYIPPGHMPADIDRCRTDLTVRLLSDYKRNATGADDWLRRIVPVNPIAAEITARDAVATLVKQIQTVTDRASASALVATL